MKCLLPKIAVLLAIAAMPPVLSAEKSVTLSDFNCSTAEVTADLSGNASFTLTFTVTNSGDEDIAVGDEGYKFQAGEFNFLGNMTLALGEIDGDADRPVGASATVTMPCSVTLPDVGTDKSVTIKVKEFFKNTVVPEYAYQCKKVNVLSPVARIGVKDGTTAVSAGSTVDYGMRPVSDAGVTVAVSNTGRSPLVINELAFNENLSGATVATALPLTIEAGASADIEMNLGTSTGGMKGAVTIKYNDAVADKEFAYAVRAALTGENDVVEQFAEGIPAGWHVAAAPGVEGANLWSTRTVNGNPLLTQGDADKKSRLITPLVTVDQQGALTVMAGHAYVPVSDSSTLTVYYSKDRETWMELGKVVKSVGTQRKPFNTFEWLDEKSNQLEWYNFSLSRLAPGDYYFAFEAGMCLLDNVYPLTAASIAQDMIMTSFSTPEEGMVNYPMSFTVDVLNMLDAAVDADSYTLTLLENDKEVASAVTENIGAYASVPLKMEYVSHSEGENSYRVMLSYGDRVMSLESKSNVLAESSEIPVQIGAVDGISNQIPLNMDAFSSKMQTIITADEIGLAPGSRITEIVLLGANTSYETTKKFAVALQAANKEEFAEGDAFVEPETFVFTEKDVVFPKAGSDTEPAKFVLELDEPYVYEGGDLLMTVKRANGFSSSLKFAYHKAAATARSAEEPLRTLSVSKSYAMSDEKTELLNEVPTFIFSVPVEPMKVMGTVVDGNTLVADAPITLKAGDVQYSGVTDAEGKFEIQVIQKGTYSLLVDYNGTEYAYSRPVKMTGSDPVVVTVNLQMTGVDSPVAEAVRITVSVGKVAVSGLRGTIKVFAADGRMAASATVEGEKEISLPAGLYIMEMTGKDGSRAVVKTHVK